MGYMVLSSETSGSSLIYYKRERQRGREKGADHRRRVARRLAAKKSWSWRSGSGSGDGHRGGGGGAGGASRWPRATRDRIEMWERVVAAVNIVSYAPDPLPFYI